MTELTLTKRHIAAVAVCWGLSIAAVLYVSIHEGTVKSGANPLEREAHLSPDMVADDYDPNEDLFSWARKHGAIIHVESAIFDKGGEKVGGVKATKDIAVGDLIIAMPQKLVLTADKARESKLGHVFDDKMNDEIVLTYFTLYIMMKFQEAGMWGHFGKALSETYLGTPTLLTPEQLEDKAKTLGLNLGRVKKDRSVWIDTVEQIAREFNPLVKKKQKEEFFTDEMLSIPNLTRAYMLFTSRFWRLDFPNGEGRIKPIPFMAPVADLLNMGKPGTSYAGYNANVLGGSFRFEAAVEFKKGEEVDFYYGGACKENLFAHYGFITSETPDCR